MLVLPTVRLRAPRCKLARVYSEEEEEMDSVVQSSTLDPIHPRVLG